MKRITHERRLRAFTRPILNSFGLTLLHPGRGRRHTGVGSFSQARTQAGGVVVLVHDPGKFILKRPSFPLHHLCCTMTDSLLHSATGGDKLLFKWQGRYYPLPHQFRLQTRSDRCLISFIYNRYSSRMVLPHQVSACDGHVGVISMHPPK